MGREQGKSHITNPQSISLLSAVQPKEGEKAEIVKKEAKPRPPPRPQVPRLPHDPLAIRTIVVSGLPAAIDSKVLWKKIRKYEGAEKVDWPVKTASGSDDPTTGTFLIPFQIALKINSVFSPCSLQDSWCSIRSCREAPCSCLQRLLTLCDTQKASRHIIEADNETCCLVRRANNEGHWRCYRTQPRQQTHRPEPAFQRNRARLAGSISSVWANILRPHTNCR